MLLHCVETVVVLQEDFDIDEAWRRGVPIISSAPTCVRTVCFLCASAGKHEVRHFVYVPDRII